MTVGPGIPHSCPNFTIKATTDKVILERPLSLVYWRLKRSRLYEACDFELKRQLYNKVVDSIPMFAEQ